MTASRLLALICMVVLAQVFIGVVWAMWRHRRDMAIAGINQASEPDLAAQSAGTPAAWPGWRSFRVAGRRYEDDSQSQISISLEPVDGVALLPFVPGQFLTFSLPLARTGDAALVRCYSLSDRPRSDRYRITVKRMLAPQSRPDVPPGVGSSWFHDSAKVGDLVQVRAPAGQFVIDHDSTVPAVFIAGGIGITPMLSMILWCLDKQPTRSLHLYYGIRNTAEYAFRDTLEDLAHRHPNFRLTPVFSGPWPETAEDTPAPAFIGIALLRQTLPAGRHRFHVCGPAAMMEALVPALTEWGVPATDIHCEAFGPASVRSPLATPPAHRASPLAVGFRVSGRTLEWTGEDASLLDLAERSGIVIDAGCRAGSCGSCETRLLAGTVEYPSPPDYPVAAGHCLPCMATPATAIELDA